MKNHRIPSICIYDYGLELSTQSGEEPIFCVIDQNKEAKKKNKQAMKMEVEEKKMTKEKIPTIRAELLDELLQGCSAMPTQEELFGPDGVVKRLSKMLIERCLQAELTTHLGYEKHEHTAEENPNQRNGYSQKTLKSEQGPIEIAIPRDRTGSFDPLLVKKDQTSVTGFNEKILWLYAHGLSTRDIAAQIQEWYGVEVSAQLISNVTEAVMEEVRQWQNRPLESLYPIVYMDCLVVKVKENQRLINKAVYLALGINLEGQKELLGMWISENEGARILAQRMH